MISEKGKVWPYFCFKTSWKKCWQNVSVALLSVGLQKWLHTLFCRLPSFPPGACSSSSSIQVEVQSASTYLKGKQTQSWPLLDGQGPWSLQGSLWRAQWRLYETNHRLKGTKACWIEAGVLVSPAPPCAVLPCGPPQPWLSACSVSSLRNALWDPPLSHRHSICLSISAVLGLLLWCSGFLYLWLMWASVALCRISCPTTCGI